MTGLPIHAGQKVAAFIYDINAHYIMIPHHLPMFFPIFGEYDDYGKIENIDDTFSYRFLTKKLGEAFMERDMLEPESVIMTDIRVWEKFSKVEDATQFKIRWKFKDVDGLLYINPESILYNDEIGFTIKCQNGVIPPEYHVSIRTKEEEKWLKEHQFDEGVKPFHFCPFNIELLAYNEDEYIQDYIEFVQFCYNVGTLRKDFVNTALGMQSEPMDKFLELNNLTHDIIMERKTELDRRHAEWEESRIKQEKIREQLDSLKDMNWPEADGNLEALKLLSKREISYHVYVALKEADKENDGIWISGLKPLIKHFKFEDKDFTDIKLSEILEKAEW